MYLTRIAGIETDSHRLYFLPIKMYLTRIAGIETRLACASSRIAPMMYLTRIAGIETINVT